MSRIRWNPTSSRFEYAPTEPPSWSEILGDLAYLDMIDIDHGSISGLLDDDHTIYALLAGRAGGQILIGGNAAGNSLTLKSTSNASKGDVNVDECNTLSLKDGAELRIYNPGSINYSGFKSPAGITTNILYSLPTNDGIDGHVLKTNGSASLRWGPLSYSILHINTTTIGNNADTNYKDTLTYNVPAGQLGATGSKLIVEATVTLASGTSDTKNIKVFFGSTSFTFTFSGSGTSGGMADIVMEVIRTGATTQKAIAHQNWQAAGGNYGPSSGSGGYAEPGETLSSPVNVKIQVQSDGGVADHTQFRFGRVLHMAVQ